MTNMLEGQANDYLQLRRTMGHKLARHDWLLRSFLAYLDATGHRTISVEVAVEWACLPAASDPRWKAARLSSVRGFAAYVHTREPALASIIPAGLIPTRVIRQQPYIYSADQTRALMETALTLEPPLRGLTLQTVIGLMATTGMRISECLGLNISDIDWTGDLLTVRGKRGNPRLVPIHPSTKTALRQYLKTSRDLSTCIDGDAFFLNMVRRRPHPTSLEQAFRSLRNDLGFAVHAGGKAPRLHDFRHAFATNALLQACRDGVDVDVRIAVLATYLGHVSPASTYWCLTAIPELLALASERVRSAQSTGALLS
ncbi:tyrosine-type recombinase/integrase [Pseudarthrobacter sp. R1]|uniref:tyrosine-type recombinase/integrase n=1 Tax=Pseudarthrobacter sp. R1 TaxID=2944934 RepID=UPI00210B1F38|nr:tyrosine-type recombinase/integrase [Pseudarthrobacter sp. R1]MCQ6269280.1 tyrosine-type recombinase/integrase [Pseudarthrobacter sp. R1]